MASDRMTATPATIARGLSSAQLPRCGDHVLHKSGEAWLVAWAEGEDIAWAGWPNGVARVADCEVTYRCTDAEHRKAVSDWAEVRDDSRRPRVLRLYGAILEQEAAHAEQE